MLKSPWHKAVFDVFYRNYREFTGPKSGQRDIAPMLWDVVKTLEEFGKSKNSIWRLMNPKPSKEAAREAIYRWAWWLSREATGSEAAADTWWPISAAGRDLVAAAQLTNDKAFNHGIDGLTYAMADALNPGEATALRRADAILPGMPMIGEHTPSMFLFAAFTLEALDAYGPMLREAFEVEFGPLPQTPTAAVHRDQEYEAQYARADHDSWLQEQTAQLTTKKVRRGARRRLLALGEFFAGADDGSEPDYDDFFRMIVATVVMGYTGALEHLEFIDGIAPAMSRDTYDDAFEGFVGAGMPEGIASDLVITIGHAAQLGDVLTEHDRRKHSEMRREALSPVLGSGYDIPDAAIQEMRMQFDSGVALAYLHRPS